MNFRQGSRDEPEINLIPFIDVLLVVLIFMVLTTTYSKYTELQVTLPVADAEQARQRPTEVLVSVSQEGRYAIGGQVIDRASAQELAQLMTQAAKSDSNAMIVINADASATHQAVITVMDAARRAGLAQITFSTQSTAGIAQGGQSKRP